MVGALTNGGSSRDDGEGHGGGNFGLGVGFALSPELAQKASFICRHLPRSWRVFAGSFIYIHTKSQEWDGKAAER